jgi:hypothetical protein
VLAVKHESFIVKRLTQILNQIPYQRLFLNPQHLTAQTKLNIPINCHTMPNPIRQLNKAFDSRIRLGIMALLMVNEKVISTP